MRFDANVNGLPWDFAPAQRSVTVHLGEERLAFYTVRSLSDEPTYGTATFNVTPEIAGRYFNKIACFCFSEQVLEARQTTEMPVSFFVDPALAQDPDLAGVSTITLSYTFFRAEPVKPLAAAARTGGAVN